MNRLSLSFKILSVVLGAGILATLVACGVFLRLDRITYREAVTAMLGARAEAIADTAAAALSFNDASAAQDILSGLAEEELVVAADLFTPQGEVFASYRRPGAEALALRPGGQGARWLGENLVYDESIRVSGDRVGEVVVAASTAVLQARERRFVRVMLELLMGYLVVGALFSRWVVRVLTRPIRGLAETATRIARERDFSVRAIPESGDEVGRLTDAFNHMLEEIQLHQTALQEAHRDLERRVEERTRDLAAATARAEQTARSLRASESRFRSLSESAPIGIFQVDDERRFTYVNPHMAELLGVPPEAAVGRLGADFLSPDQRASVAAETPTIREQWSTEFRVGESGAERWVVARVSPYRDEAGGEGLVGTMADVTVQRRAAAEREAMHRERMKLSREAGMAEVATGVLHNVGNVLNSVNVSAELIQDRLGRSTLKDLAALSKLVSEGAGRDGGFFTSDPRGQRVPRFLELVTGALQSERDALREEVASLVGSVQHVKRVVQMQQSFARVSSVLERVDLASLVDEALGFSLFILEKNHIRLERAYAPLPEVEIDKHKVLQILINLVSNAKHALIRSEARERRLTLRVRAEGGRALIEVEDNGEGISAENLGKIFSYGFTTKEDGHGFGLHGSVLAAREIGGDLSAHSDGRGLGARFTLTLPAPDLKEGEVEEGELGEGARRAG